MMAALLKAVLDWLTGLVRTEIKKDTKATDVKTPTDITDSFRNSIKRKLRDNKGCVCVGECKCGKCR